MSAAQISLWVSGNTRRVKVRNDIIYPKVGVTSIEEKTKEKKKGELLKMVGHV